MYVCVCVSHVAKFRLNTPSFNSSINFTKDIFLEVYYCSLMQVLSHGMVMSERAIYKGTKQDWHKNILNMCFQERSSHPNILTLSMLKEIRLSKLKCFGLNFRGFRCLKTFAGSKLGRASNNPFIEQ